MRLVGCGIILLVILALLAAVVVGGIKSTAVHVHGVVLATYVKAGSKSSDYMAVVKRDDGSTEVFKDSDSVTFLKFNSSDVYAQLIADRKSHAEVDLYVYGWRFPFLSMYRDIISVTP